MTARVPMRGVGEAASWLRGRHVARDHRCAVSDRTAGGSPVFTYAVRGYFNGRRGLLADRMELKAHGDEAVREPADGRSRGEYGRNHGCRGY
jgi:hypothetical protein